MRWSKLLNPICGGTQRVRQTGLDRLKAINAYRPITMTMIGDSITAGSAPGGSNGVGGMFGRMMGVTGGKFLNVSNMNRPTEYYPGSSYGVSGLTVNGLQTAAYRNYHIEEKPMAVADWLGHNDITASGTAMTSAEQKTLKDKRVALIEYRRACGLESIVMELVPTTTKDRSSIIVHNAAMKQWCADHGVVYIEGFFSVMDGNQGTLTSDGIHPNNAGYIALQEPWKAWVKANLPNDFVLGAGSLDASQTGYIANFAATTGSFGSYGYGGTAGTFTTATIAKETSGLMADALEITKTGGQGIVVFDKSYASGWSVNDYVLFTIPYKASGMVAGGSILYSDISCATGHGAGVNPWFGAHDTGNEWHYLHAMYRIPASSTAINYKLYFRQETTAATSSTGVLTVGAPQIVNLTTTYAARNMGLVGSS